MEWAKLSRSKEGHPSFQFHDLGEENRKFPLKVRESTFTNDPLVHQMLTNSSSKATQISTFLSSTCSIIWLVWPYPYAWYHSTLCGNLPSNHILTQEDKPTSSVPNVIQSHSSKHVPNAFLLLRIDVVFIRNSIPRVMPFVTSFQ